MVVEWWIQRRRTVVNTVKNWRFTMRFFAGLNNPTTLRLNSLLSTMSFGLTSVAFLLGKLSLSFSLHVFVTVRCISIWSLMLSVFIWNWVDCGEIMPDEICYPVNILRLSILISFYWWIVKIKFQIEIRVQWSMWNYSCW